MPPVDFASVRALRERRLIENVEMGLVRSPTETTWISVTAAPVALPGIDLVIAYADITARKQAEQLLQERETRFRALIENAPDGVVLVSREGRMTYASPAAGRMFGADTAQVDEVSPDENTHPEDLPRVLAALEQLLRDPAEVKTLQDRFRHADGPWIWIESTFTNLLGVPGVNAIVINFRNIHDRKIAEDALQERDALLREMGRVAKVGGWEFDAATGAGRWTEEVARIHDLPPDTQPTKTLVLSFYPGEAGEQIRAAVAKAVSQGVAYDLELEFLSARGVHKWVHTIGQPVWEDGRVVKLRGAIQDITERKQAEAALQESLLFRREAEKIARIGAWKVNPDTDFLYWTEKACMRSSRLRWTTNRACARACSSTMRSPPPGCGRHCMRRWRTAPRFGSKSA
jgi:PAS domain S-box-containing protein